MIWFGLFPCFQCADGVAYETPCKRGLAYTAEKHVCDYPDNVYDCKGKSETVTGFKCPSPDELPPNAVARRFLPYPRRVYSLENNACINGLCECSIPFLNMYYLFYINIFFAGSPCLETITHTSCVLPISRGSNTVAKDPSLTQPPSAASTMTSLTWLAPHTLDPSKCQDGLSTNLQVKQQYLSFDFLWSDANLFRLFILLSL